MSNEPESSAEANSAWDEPVVESPHDLEDALIVDVGGYEGPLDLLLALARTQKVDIAKISVLALANQYLLFIAEAQKVRLELAADYLVMAAWLAYLKSRLLLPRETVQGEDVSAEELARRLSFRLMRLDAMREAAAQLMNRMRLGRDVFQRGMPEGAKTIRETTHTADRLRPVARLRRPAPPHHQGRARDQGARGVVDQGGARAPGAAHGRRAFGRRVDGVRRISAERARHRRRRQDGDRELLRRDARDGARRHKSRSARRRRSRRSTCGRASRAPSGSAWSRELVASQNR